VNHSFIVIQALNGLASASTLFITASGLTLVFGVTRIVNFAHGSLYMLGAYLAATLAPRLMHQLPPGFGFWAAIVLSALIAATAGALFEILVLRRVYRASELYQLLATFGAVLVVGDLVILIFGREDIFGARVPGLEFSVSIVGRRFPVYDLVLIAIGPVVLAALTFFLHKTRFGVLVRAATQDRTMVGVLGVNQALLFTGIFFVGSFLAGLGGALQTPRVPANSQMDISIITECFVVTVIGGMGSIPGAFLAALAIGQLQAFGILILPKITLVLVFALMAIVLIIRPQGFFGRVESSGGSAAFADDSSNWTRSHTIATIALISLVLVLPFVSDDYSLKLLTEIFILALYAVSLHFLLVTGGMVSFGHAAYFGLGAYAAALLVKHLAAPMELALFGAPIFAFVGAAAIGFFVVRLKGTYLAMLSLAAAQIVYAVAFQWTEFTGGDNGLIGIWPSAWASSRHAYYLLTFVVVAIVIALLRYATITPFGFTLRATRDNEVRSSAVGIDVLNHRRIAFAISGAAAGVAGGLHAFMNGSVDPTLLSVSTSVDALIMLLIGGLQTVVGALLGAIVLHELKNEFLAISDYWRLFLGASIIILIILMPNGLTGACRGLKDRWLHVRHKKQARAGGSHGLA
jgi:branched-chain amino acid transport system permease protein